MMRIYIKGQNVNGCSKKKSVHQLKNKKENIEHSNYIYYHVTNRSEQIHIFRITLENTQMWQMSVKFPLE